MKELTRQLERLCLIPSVSGFEEEFAGLLQEFLASHVDGIERDRLSANGNG